MRVPWMLVKNKGSCAAPCTNSESLRWAGNVHLNKIVRWFLCSLLRIYWHISSGDMNLMNSRYQCCFTLKAYALILPIQFENVCWIRWWVAACQVQLQCWKNHIALSCSGPVQSSSHRSVLVLICSQNLFDGVNL